MIESAEANWPQTKNGTQNKSEKEFFMIESPNQNSAVALTEDRKSDFDENRIGQETSQHQRNAILDDAIRDWKQLAVFRNVN